MLRRMIDEHPNLTLIVVGVPTTVLFGLVVWAAVYWQPFWSFLVGGLTLGLASVIVYMVVSFAGLVFLSALGINLAEGSDSFVYKENGLWTKIPGLREKKR